MIENTDAKTTTEPFYEAVLELQVCAPHHFMLCLVQYILYMFKILENRNTNTSIPCVQQFTVVCHVIVVTVDFQTTFEDVLVCDLELMALLTLLFLSLSTEHRNMSSFCVC